MSVTMRKFLRSDYEEWLNDVSWPDDDMAPHGRIPHSYINSYGTWLRRHDPIAFNVGYNEWILERRWLNNDRWNNN